MSWIINLSHLCKLRNRKKGLENFEKFISQERHTRTFIWSAYCAFLASSSNDNQDHCQKMICTRIVIMKYCENNTNILIYVLQMNVLKRAYKLSNFELQRLHNVKFQNPTAWGLKIVIGFNLLLSQLFWSRFRFLNVFCWSSGGPIGALMPLLIFDFLSSDIRARISSLLSFESTPRSRMSPAANFISQSSTDESFKVDDSFNINDSFTSFFSDISMIDESTSSGFSSTGFSAT